MTIVAMTASEPGNGSILLWMLELFLFLVWFWLLIVVFGDLFRDNKASGFAKVMWVILLIILPYLGAFLYLLIRGRGMSERAAEQRSAMNAEVDQRIRSVANSSTSPADQIAQAKSLLDSGAITQIEFDSLKAQALRG